MSSAEDGGLAEICEELDRVILHFFDVLEVLQSKREAFNNLVEQGWFSLSKSRYAMGNKSVSTLQYGHQMTPLIRIKTRDEFISLLLAVSSLRSSTREEGHTEFRVISEGSSKHKEEGTLMVEEIGPSEQVIRRRKGPEKIESQVKQQNTTSQPAEKLGHQDPLNWFGILVPQSLRQAQKTFQEGIHLAAEIASVQSEIEATQDYYHTLLGKKQSLVAAEKQCSL